MKLVNWLRDRRAELLGFTTAAVNLGQLFDWWSWTEEQIAGANLFAAAALTVIIGRAKTQEPVR